MRTSWSRRSRLSALALVVLWKRRLARTVDVRHELRTRRAHIAADERGAKSGMYQSGCFAIS